MKFKTTRKEVMGGYRTVISVDFAELQHLLDGQHPVAETRGKDGAWHADIYQMPFNENICIATGYVPFGNITPNAELVLTYNRIARESKAGTDLSGLLRSFVSACIAEDNYRKFEQENKA